jgi:hypothetical protein
VLELKFGSDGLTAVGKESLSWTEAEERMTIGDEGRRLWVTVGLPKTRDSVIGRQQCVGQESSVLTKR